MAGVGTRELLEPNGRVGAVTLEVASGSVGREELLRCIQARIERLRFPPRRDPDPVTVSVPIDLRDH